VDMRLLYILLPGIFISFAINAILTPFIIRLSHRRKWYDVPDKRKIHKGLIPRLGGVGMFASVVLTSVLVSLFLLMIERQNGFFELRYLSVLAGIALIHYLGLFDDFHNLRALYKFLIQIMAAIVVSTSGFLINSISLPYLGTYSLGFLAYPITVIWIVGIANSVNLVDGMDGLAGGIATFASLSMGIIAIIQGQFMTALLALILFGSIVGFMIFNFPPARIFMGDSGSLFLGITLAVIPLMGISKTASFSTLIIPITLLTVPIIDMMAAIIRRIRKGRSIASPDKEHIHHKLLEMGLNERKILTFVYGFSFYLSIVAITSVILPKETNVYFIVIVWTGSLLGYYFLDFLKEKKKTSTQHEQNRKDSTAS
jgi:UDP-GlcNAc:undecaprenyl-phosphate GlcNAc-1-phosphate transferase